MNLVSTYNGKNVLITGHTGFKGSWLSLWLSKMGANVFGYSPQPNSYPNNYTLSDVGDLIAGENTADIRDKTALNKAIKESEPDYIFHLAAQPIVRESYNRPIETFEINVIGSLNVLEGLRNLEQPCAVIMVTSDKCYKNTGQVWGYREIDPLGGYDPYSASKAAAEIAISSFRNSFFPKGNIEKHRVNIATVRAGNVIGGGDWSKDRIIPDAVKALSKGDIVPIRNPHAVRPWQHVIEPLFGYIILAAKMSIVNNPDLCSAWNFGPLPNSESPVSNLMDLFCKEWGDGRWNHLSLHEEPHEASVLRLSIDKAVHELNWSPRWDLCETVKRTVGWYKKYCSNDTDAMQDACFTDIDAYLGGTHGN